MDNLCGVGLHPPSPEEWQNHQWMCSGTPSEARTAELVAAIKGGTILPTALDLSADTELEASAARALDQGFLIVLSILFLFLLRIPLCFFGKLFC